MRTKRVLVLSTIFVLMFLGMALPATRVQAAVGLTCPSEVRIGNLLSCKATGLTTGTNYIAIAQHSDGNISKVLTASGSTEYFRFTMTTADTDGLVAIALDTATDAGAATGGDDATSLVNLVDPGTDIPSAFFQNLLAPILIIGIFVLLISAFFIGKRARK